MTSLRKFDRRLGVHYGAISLYTSVLHNLFLLYHVEMFVSVYKIDKFSFWLGEVVFLVWNSCNDPLFGWLSDRQYLMKTTDSDNAQVVLSRLQLLSRYGPAFAISFLAFWVAWTFPSLQFVICLCAYDGFLTMIDLHHTSLLADLSLSADVRTRLNMYCSLFSALGSASVFVSYAIWSRERLFPFQLMCVALAVVSGVGFVVSARVLGALYTQISEERSVGTVDKKDGRNDELMELGDEKAALKKFLRELAGHKNFLFFTAMNVVQVFHCHFNSNFFPLFMENLIGDDVSPLICSFILGVSFVAPHVNNLYFLNLCRRYGAYRVIRFLFALKLALSVAMLFVSPGQIWILCAFIASNRVFTEGTCKLLNLVISDLVDEDVVIHHRPQAVSALMFGTIAFLSKPGQTIAPLLGTWLLSITTGKPQAVSALMFGTIAFLSKPGQTIAPLLLSITTGHDVFESASETGSIKVNLEGMSTGVRSAYQLGVFQLLIYVPMICASLQLLAWSRFSLHGKRLDLVKSTRDGFKHVFV